MNILQEGSEIHKLHNEPSTACKLLSQLVQGNSNLDERQKMKHNETNHTFRSHGDCKVHPFINCKKYETIFCGSKWRFEVVIKNKGFSNLSFWVFPSDRFFFLNENYFRPGNILKSFSVLLLLFTCNSSGTASVPHPNRFSTPNKKWGGSHKCLPAFPLFVFPLWPWEGTSTCSFFFFYMS